MDTWPRPYGPRDGWMVAAMLAVLLVVVMLVACLVHAQVPSTPKAPSTPVAPVARPLNTGFGVIVDGKLVCPKGLNECPPCPMGCTCTLAGEVTCGGAKP